MALHSPWIDIVKHASSLDEEWTHTGRLDVAAKYFQFQTQRLIESNSSEFAWTIVNQFGDTDVSSQRRNCHNMTVIFLKHGR